MEQQDFSLLYRMMEVRSVMTSVTIQAFWNDELFEVRSPGQRQMKALGLLQIFAKSAERAFLLTL